LRIELGGGTKYIVFGVNILMAE